MFNLSTIMTNAWAMYRQQYRNRPKFMRNLFQWLLMVSWKKAKDAALRASNPILAKIEALQEQLELLSYKPWRVDIEHRRQSLKAEIARLSAI